MAFNFNTDDIFSGAKDSAVNAVTNTTVNVGKTSDVAASTGEKAIPKQTNIVDHRAKMNIKPNDLSRLTAAAKQKDGNKTPHPSESVLGPRGDKTNILAPLFGTNGVVFPYTPTLSSTHIANYTEQQYTHSNYTQQAYSSSDITNLTLEATFTSQTEAEARYTIAAIHFFRTVTKMFSGSGPDGKLGGPPPVLLFNYLGSMFHNVPIVIKSFTPSFPMDNDIVTIRYSDDIGDISVPTIMSFNIVFENQYNPYLMKDKKQGFNLDKFRQGKLLKRGYI